MKETRMALTDQVTYALYIALAAMSLLSLIAKWLMKKVDSVEEIAKGFVATHDKLAESAHSFMMKTTETSGGFLHRLESIDKTLDGHGEKLDSHSEKLEIIDRRTVHLEPGLRNPSKNPLRSPLADH